MFQNIIEIIKMPVTTMIEQSRRDDLKKGAIKGLLLSVLMSFISVITTFFAIIKSITKKSSWYGEYSSAEVWEKRWKKIEEAELFSAFFKQILIYAIVIAVIAFILYVIAKLVKRDKDYSETLSFVNNTFILFVMGMLIHSVVSFIYVPLAILLSFVVNVYAVLTLMYAFKESLDMVDIDKLVLAFTGVITATIVIVVVFFMIIFNVSFKNLSDLEDIMEMLSSNSSDISDYLDF